MSEAKCCGTCANYQKRHPVWGWCESKPQPQWLVLEGIHVVRYVDGKDCECWEAKAAK